jgi:ADP-ribosylglycohydrolase
VTPARISRSPRTPKGSITDDTEQAILVGQLLVEGEADRPSRSPGG